MNMQEAAERADAMLDATIKAVVPEIHWSHHVTTAGNCVVNRRRAVMTIISEQRRGSLLGVIERFWKKSGYTITSVNTDPENPAIFARTPEDFQIDLTIGAKGQAFFEVQTPCVQESEVAEPTTKPNGPNYAGQEIPYPNVRSDFWSTTGTAASPSTGPIPGGTHEVDTTYPEDRSRPPGA
ncbi:hypothetical protein GCM10020367_40440 [Streptomyces sannanensis]|uniref:Uncharacterized protein n=1 Tax=Streptomyces sannanensis TaxID=285536 RepID=A0ABP6SEJ5_9ACTN